MSKEVTADVCQYLSRNKDIVNDIVIKIESDGIDTLLEKGITSLDALVNIVENSKGSVMTRDSRDSVSPAIVTPGNSPQNSPKASGKKGSLTGKGKTRKKTNKRTKKRKPKRKTRK